MTVHTNLPSEGRIGIEPPADAPREVSQPLSAELIAEQSAKARMNERTLAPLTYGQTTPTAVEDGAVKVPGEVQPAKDVQAAPGQGRYVDAPTKSEFPAASNSDSPSRGLPGTAPVPAVRKNAPLQAIGGFGEAEAEYYPLDGREALVLANQLLDELHDRLQNDLRFSMAVTYPRLSMKLQLVIEGEAADQTQKIERVAVDPKLTRTPLEVAQSRGDSVVFVVTQQRREFDDVGNVESPSDAMREELGLKIPRKRQIKTGAGSALVDVTW